MRKLRNGAAGASLEKAGERQAFTVRLYQIIIDKQSAGTVCSGAFV